MKEQHVVLLQTRPTGDGVPHLMLVGAHDDEGKAREHAANVEERFGGACVLVLKGLCST